MNKLYKSKSSKTKVTDLHYVSDKNHSDSKLCQKGKNSVHKCSNFGNLILLYSNKTMKAQSVLYYYMSLIN